MSARTGVTLIGLLAVVLGACAAPVERPLPAFDGGLRCRGVGFDDVTIAGDPEATPPVWLVHRSDGQRMEAAWPPGSFARFSEKLEIVLTSGAIFYVEGDNIDGGCFTADEGVWGIKESRYGTPPQP